MRARGSLQARVGRTPLFTTHSILTVMPLASVNQIARSGRIRLLAITNGRHAPAARDIPTVAQSGYPQLTFGGMLGMFGPKDMSAELRERIAVDMCGVLAEPAVLAPLAKIGMAAHSATRPSSQPFLMSSMRSGPRLPTTTESSQRTREAPNAADGQTVRKHATSGRSVQGAAVACHF